MAQPFSYIVSVLSVGNSGFELFFFCLSCQYEYFGLDLLFHWTSYSAFTLRIYILPNPSSSD